MTPKAKVMVIGGSGFIGSATVDELVRNKYDVLVYDLVKPEREDVQFIKGSILEKDAILAAAEGCDFIYHFAGWADMAKSKESPSKVIELNIIGTTNILEVCAKLNIKKFIFASSMYVFSQAGSFYRASKQCCELLIEEYSKTFNFGYCILRYGSLYGPGATHGNAIYELINQAILNKEITYWGTGEEIRQYIHVKDAAKGSVSILAPDFNESYVSLTGIEDIQIKNLLKMINEILGGKIEIKTTKDPQSMTHYTITPFNFMPKTGCKLIFSMYKDLGQGILECIHEVHTSMLEINNNAKI